MTWRIADQLVCFKRILIYSDLKYDPPRRPRKMRIIDPRRSTLPFIRRQTGKHFLDVVELFSSNTGLSWMMSRLNMRVGEPIDHKHVWSFNSKTKLYQGWSQLEGLDPEYVLVTNPAPNSWRHSIYKLCLELMKWQISRGKGFW